jgi:dienelactone hydrolase
MPTPCSLLLLLAVQVAAQVAAPQSPAAPALVPRDWLTVRLVDTIRARRPFRRDAVFERYLLQPDAEPPATGDTVVGEHGEGTWEPLEADESGKLEGGIGYAYCAFEVPETTFALARLTGAASLFIDGQGYAGDYYGFGFAGVPVELTAGRHDLFVTGHRGSQRLQFTPVDEGLMSGDWDQIAPHLLPGERPSGYLGALLVNVSREPSGPLVVVYGGTSLGAEVIDEGRVELPQGIAALGQLKVALPLSGPAVASEPGTRHLVPVRVLSADGTERLRFEMTLEVRPDGERFLRSYLSEVDGTAQEYALLPPLPAPLSTTDQADEHPMQLALGLHGASVRCWGQVNTYPRTTDFWIVAPNNRRKFGFDFQDWGRRDVYDALADALAYTGVERSRVFVTGHSMGGHGSWHLPANDADGFAGTGPAAGWESFDSYAGRPRGALYELWAGADSSTRTLSLIDNLRQVPAYIRHGTNDNNVPVSHALMMIEALTSAQASFKVDMISGIGHGGNGRQHWAETLEFFRGRTIPENPGMLDFTSADPGVDAEHHWLRVELPLTFGSNLRVRGGRAKDSDRIELETTNVAVLAILDGAPDVETALVDGTELELGESRPVWLERLDADGAWQRFLPANDGTRKTARRSGPFKRAFDRRFVVVVGTGGDVARDAELAARARYDAGIWNYRANGRYEIVSDTAFLEGDFSGRNVILYGNRDTNAAWDAVLPEDCPVDAREGSIRCRDQLFSGDDLAAVFVYPRRGSVDALVGVFADSGAPGGRLGYTLAPFVSGIGYPDYVVFGSSVLTEEDAGVRDAGWFTAHWR